MELLTLPDPSQKTRLRRAGNSMPLEGCKLADFSSFGWPSFSGRTSEDVRVKHVFPIHEHPYWGTVDFGIPGAPLDGEPFIHSVDLGRHKLLEAELRLLPSVVPPFPTLLCSYISSIRRAV